LDHFPSRFLGTIVTEPLAPLSAEQIHLAISIFLRHAYPGGVPSESAAALLPPEGDFAIEPWMMGTMIERTPLEATYREIRTAAIRLGNAVYPNMKLRLARAPKSDAFLLSVDSHDAMLEVPVGSPEEAMLEQLKTHNATVGQAIQTDWDQADLPTERNYMRLLIAQRKASQ
jgi:hypothetical protein